MKRICSLVLVLCMVLSMVVVPTLAEEATTTVGGTKTPLTGPITQIGATDTTVTVGGVNYTVIRTAEDFKTKMTAGGNFILANDIDFGPAVAPAEVTEGETPAAPDTSHAFTGYVVQATEQAFTFDGNGYTLSNMSFNFAARASLFSVSGHTATVKNLKITTGNVMNFTGFSGILFTNATADAVIDNVDIHVTELTVSAAKAVGLYMGTTAATGTVSFKDCDLTGNINMAQQINSGFITQSYSTVTLENCVADVTWNKSGNRNVPFIGEIMSGSVTMTECTAAGTLIEDGGKWCSPFVSGITAGNVTLTRCDNAMNVRTKGDRTGGLIGGYLGNTGKSHVIIEDCVVSGTSWNGQSAWMAQAGTGGANATMEFKGTNKVTGYVLLGGADPVATMPNAPDPTNVINTAAMDPSTGELAFYYAAAQKLEGITDPAEIYGQQIGVDARPVKGGMTVYRRMNADGTFSYRNKAYRTPVKLDIAADATTVVDGETTYTVVRTVEQFKAMTDGNYILANDLDFAGEKFTAGVVSAANINFRGNTYSLNNLVFEFTDATAAANAALFVVTGTAKIQDVTINATLTTSVTRTAVLLGGVSNFKATVEGVTINADINSTIQKVGAFAGMVTGANSAISFQDCAYNGKITAGALQTAGFVGCLESATAEFTDCSANANIAATANRVTAYVGQFNSAGTLNFTDCTATGTLIQKATNYGAASFVGCFNGDNLAPNITFDGCSTDMTIVSEGQAGGFVSGVRKETDAPTVKFKNCINAATIISGTKAGAWVGQTAAGTYTVENCINNATVTAPTIVTFAENENTTAKVKDLSALNVANGELAYALADAQKNLRLEAKYIFGQTIGTDAAPKMDGAKVYKGKDLADNDIYTNTADFTAVEIPAGATTVNQGGVTYNVIRTLDELKAMRGNSMKDLNTKNYILANDIDLGGVELDVAKGIDGTANVYGFIYFWSGVLDGNGFTIKNFKLIGDKLGFFDTSSTKVDITVKNIAFGTPEQLIYTAQTGAGGAGVIAAVVNNNSNITLENVDVYGDITSAGAPTTTSAQKGGFIGTIINVTSNESVITMRDCTMNGKVHGRNKIAGFVGSNYSLATISMYDCVNYAEVTGRTQVGAFMGISQVGATVYFENCVNAGKVINVDTQNADAPDFNDPTVGAIIGQTPSQASGGTTTLRNCENTGEVIGALNNNALVGQHKVALAGTKNVLNIYTKDADATIETLVAATDASAENADTVINLVKLTVSTIADEAGLKAALAVSGVYTLTADITLSAALEMNVPEGVDVTLILAGKTITGNVTVGGVGNLTIKNGTIKATTGTALTLLEDTLLKLINVTVEATAATAAVIEGDLTAEDSTFTGTANAVEFHKGSQSTLTNCTANGTILGAADGIASSADQKDGMDVTINGGTYDAVVWEAEATLTIKAGTFEVQNGDVLTIKNGTVVVTGASMKGTNFIKIAPAAADTTIIVTVGGGEFFGDIVVAGANTIVTLSGGRYEKALDNALLDKGYEFAKGAEDTMYEIKFHTHTYSDAWTNYNSGSHKKQCTFPGCDEGPMEAHTWSAATDNGDGKHSKVCSVCNGKSTAQVHKLTVTDNGDGTHSQTCKDCNLNNTVAHTYGDATSIAGGKHEKACADCGYVLTEDCTAGENGKCTCGATIGGGEQTGGKKGCKGSISGGLFVLLSVLAVPAVTVRKRRED